MTKSNSNQITIKPLNLPTMLKVIEASLGSLMFQTSLALVNGRKRDILNRGQLACAFYVLAILAMFGLIDRVHSTVAGTVKAMKRAGWQPTNKLSTGVVIIWGRPVSGDHDHEHIGFVLSQTKAASNSSELKVPVRHHITFGAKATPGYRQIIGLYYHPKLKQV